MIGELTVLICPYCGKLAKLCNGDEVYPRRTDLHKLRFWNCVPCDARVGTHKGTVKPLGRLANAQLRYWKMKAHEAFDPRWRGGDLKRKDAYSWLADRMGLKNGDCHIGMMDVSQCKKVVDICDE